MSDQYNPQEVKKMITGEGKTSSQRVLLVIAGLIVPLAILVFFGSLKKEVKAITKEELEQHRTREQEDLESDIKVNFDQELTHIPDEVYREFRSVGFDDTEIKEILKAVSLTREELEEFCRIMLIPHGFVTLKSDMAKRRIIRYKLRRLPEGLRNKILSAICFRFPEICNGDPSGGMKITKSTSLEELDEYFEIDGRLWKLFLSEGVEDVEDLMDLHEKGKSYFLSKLESEVLYQEFEDILEWISFLLEEE